MNDEIIKLQEMLIHQGEYIEKMSSELYMQQKEISVLKNKLQKLENKLKEQAEGSNIRSLDEETPPPHY
jgi:uncharacterized coiled-coil protein SlyX